MRYYGAAYYPEQETDEGVATDVALMQQAGFNAVRIGEFAWSRFEPRDGEFDFAWLDRALARLAAAGIATVLCTPTACPPLWMVERHPDILYRDNRGVVRPFGGRRHYCYNNATYRSFSRRIAAEIGRRYADDPRVLAFHIDNELAQEATGRCQCDTCRTLFRSWLERRYRTIDEFNRLAGTIFWSQTYERFEQIQPPLTTIEPGAAQLIEPFVDNPTLRLDFERFCSDSVTGYQNEQAVALRAHSRKPVTTNSCGFWTNGNDLHESFRTLDVAGVDAYPSLRTNDMYGATCDYAFTRGLKDAGFWVLETSSGGGQGVWARQGIPQPFPGALRQAALQAFACGAELLTYFQFRTFRFGAEQLEAAVMDIDGLPRRRFREFQQVSKDLAALTPLLESSRVANDVAICFDYDSHWAIRIKPFFRSYSYSGQIQQIASALAQRGIGADVIASGSDLSRYKLVIVPTPVIMKEPFKRLLKEYVRGGGAVLTNFLAAIKDEHNTAPRESAPAGLVDLFGVRVGEGEPVCRESWQDLSAEVRIAIGDQEFRGRNHTWTEGLEPQGAEVIGTYVDSFRAGEAVATRNRFGAGTAWYLGTWLEEPMLAGFLATVAQASGVAAAPFRFGHGVEAIRRQRGQEDVHFLFNYREKDSEVELQGSFRDLLGGRSLSGAIVMKPKESLVLERMR